jgi:hypothetical protein
LSAAVYDRGDNELLSKGIFLDLPAWGYHVFEVGEPLPTEATVNMMRETTVN